MPSHRDILEIWFRRVWTEEDTSAIDEMLRPDMQVRGLGDQPRLGPTEFKVFHCNLLSQLKEFVITIDRSADDADWIWALCMMKAQCRKTGKAVQASGQVLVRMDDGLLVEAYNHWDFMGLFQQLGLVPEAGFERCLSGERIA